jgi:hypothetical protein
MITKDSPRLEYNFKFKNNIKLKPFQYATVYKMLEFENFIPKKISKEKSMYLKLEYNYKHNWFYKSKKKLDETYIGKNDTKLYSNIGILSNNVGSGKSLIILSLILYKNQTHTYNKYTIQDKKLYNLFTNLPKDITNHISKFLKPELGFQLMTYIKKNHEVNNLFYLEKYNNIHIKTNLIIVSHIIYNQWKNEITNKTNLNILCISNIAQIKKINNINNLEEYDIILCNANKLKDLYIKTKNCIWSRIFVDEADIINIPNFPDLQSNFLWLITTTYERLTKPTNNGFIKNIFNSFTGSNYKKIIFKSLLIKCEESFIHNYIDLKQVEKKYIKPLTPLINKILFKMNFFRNNKILQHFDNYLYIDAKLQQTLYNNGWIRFTHTYYIPNKNNNIYTRIIFNIFLLLMEKIKDYKILLENRIKYYIKNSKKIIFIKIKKDMEIINKYLCIYQFIKESLINNSICIYCFKSYDGYIYNKNEFCCQNCNVDLSELRYQYHVYDFEKNIKTYKISLEQCSVIMNIPLQNEYIHPLVLNKDVILNNSIKYIYLLEKIYKDIKNKKRILIFSNTYTIFTKIETLLKRNNLKYQILKGNNHVIKNMLNKYKNKEINILLLNMKYSGSGLNLQMTDNIYIINYIDKDTEKQVIGRVQRIGQKKSVNVNYILYEEEIKN